MTEGRTRIADSFSSSSSTSPAAAHEEDEVGDGPRVEGMEESREEKEVTGRTC